MGLFGNNNNAQPQQQTGMLNLGANNMGAQPQQQISPFASQNMQQGMMGQPMQPPSELDIQLALLKSLAPMDRFIGGAQMGILLQLMGDLVSLSVLTVLKHATFKVDDEGLMKMDIATLPTNLQTMSGENITSQFNALQMSAQQNIQNAEMQQQQIAALAQQSMMGGALSAAMMDEGFMNKVGGATGNFMGKMIGMK